MKQASVEDFNLFMMCPALNPSALASPSRGVYRSVLPRTGAGFLDDLSL